MKASRPTRKPIWRCGPTLTCSTSGLTHQDGPLPKAPCKLRASIYVCQLLSSFKAASPSKDIKSLADLIQPERFKAILRHYHNQANGLTERLCHLPRSDPDPGC